MWDITNKELDELETLAKAATPGLWEEWHAAGYPYIVQTNMDGMIDVIAECRMRNNSIYIAAANPATILELIKEVRKIRQKISPCENCETPCEYEGESDDRCLLEQVANCDKW